MGKKIGLRFVDAHACMLNNTCVVKVERRERESGLLTAVLLAGVILALSVMA